MTLMRLALTMFTISLYATFCHAQEELNSVKIGMCKRILSCTKENYIATSDQYGELNVKINYKDQIIPMYLVKVDDSLSGSDFSIVYTLAQNELLMGNQSVDLTWIKDFLNDFNQAIFNAVFNIKYYRNKLNINETTLKGPSSLISLESKLHLDQSSLCGDSIHNADNALFLIVPIAGQIKISDQCPTNEEIKSIIKDNNTKTKTDKDPTKA